MKLTFENIFFIDNYLENSDIIYKDIRMEMIDHVASGIETKISEGDNRDFYYVFKDYMIENKGKLLNNNKQFIKSADNKLIKLILKELIKWPCVITFLVLMAFFKYLNFTTEISIVKSWLGVLPLISFTLLGIVYVIALRFYKLNRFSSLERLGFIFAMSFQLFHFCWNISHLEFMTGFEYVIIGLVSLTLSILLAMILVTVKQMKHYQTKFKSLT
jgi:hypothetical protein